MQLTHTMDDIQVLHIECLNLLGKVIVVRTLASLEIGKFLRFNRWRCIGSGGGLDDLFHDFIDLGLHLADLVAGELLKAEVQVLLKLPFDELCLAFGIDGDVVVHDTVARKLEQHKGTFIPILLRVRRVHPGL